MVFVVVGRGVIDGVVSLSGIIRVIVGRRARVVFGVRRRECDV